jgi:hypothetical protein
VNSNQPPTSNPTHKTKQTKQNKKQNKTNKQNKQKQNKQKTKQNSDITIKKSLQLNQNSLHHFTSASNKENIAAARTSSETPLFPTSPAHQKNHQTQHTQSNPHHVVGDDHITEERKHERGMRAIVAETTTGGKNGSPK